MNREFRNIPSVDKLISDDRIKKLQENLSEPLLVGLVRRYLEQLRLSIAAGNSCPSVDDIVESIRMEVADLTSLSLRPMVNATGVILHTNLGRAPMSKDAIEAMEMASKGYCNLELDIDSGRRGSRNVHIEKLLCELTGAEAALVVNNNASAVMLGLSAVAKRKEVIVSRGQAVQIGGGFRVPDVMRQSGAKLVEVGTTNWTQITDYEQAITPRTAALMRVHSSNFKLMGFTNETSLEELVALGNKHDIPLLDDLGSGCFLNTEEFGLDAEPMVQESVAGGADLVFFSGDKLLCGPQAGIIVGKKVYVDKLKKHPMARAVRFDKVRMAGLAMTLIHYLKGEAVEKLPVWRMIATPVEEIDRRAWIWAQSINDIAEVVEGESMVGGGSLPGGTLPTRLVAIGGGDRKKGRNMAQTLSQKLRCRDIPVMGRINDDVLLLDPRSVFPEEDNIVIQALQESVAGLKR